MQFQSKSLCIFFAGALLLVGVNSGAFGEEDSSDLAKKLSNPVANLISVPLQNNVDWGRNDEFHYQINFQPVVPFTLSQDWDVIVRTIVPFVTQSDVLPGSSQIGLGDTTQSFFFVPTKIGGGWILGVGPDLLYPTASFGIGARYTPEAPINAPQWGFRFVVTYLFPKK